MKLTEWIKRYVNQIEAIDPRPGSDEFLIFLALFGLAKISDVEVTTPLTPEQHATADVKEATLEVHH